MSQNNSVSAGDVFGGIAGIAGGLVAIGAIILAFKNMNNPNAKLNYEVPKQGRVNTNYTCQVPAEPPQPQPQYNPQMTYNMPVQPIVQPQPFIPAPPVVVTPPPVVYPQQQPVVQPVIQPVVQAPIQQPVVNTNPWGPAAYVATVASYVPQPMSYAPAQNPQMYRQQPFSNGDTMADRYNWSSVIPRGGPVTPACGAVPQSQCQYTAYAPQQYTYKLSPDTPKAFWTTFRPLNQPGLWNNVGPTPINQQTQSPIQQPNYAYQRTYPNGSVSFAQIPARYDDYGMLRV